MKIGSFDIHAGVVWSNEVISSKAVQQETTTMLGNINVVHAQILKKRMVFEARDSGKKSRGFFSRDVVDYLMLAEKNNSQFVVEYRGISYTVYVPAGGVSLIPKRETEDTDTTDPYTGTVTFQEI
jgi:hypothetical protein